MQLLFFFLLLISVFIITVMISRRLIPFLKSKKMGQTILDIGPRWHKSKEGTPTMGGLAFIGAIVFVSALCFAALALACAFGMTDNTFSALAKPFFPYLLTLGYAVLSGMVGVIDDSKKIQKRQNEGLTAPQKYALQLITAAVYLLAMHLCGYITTVLYIPFVRLSVDFGIFYYGIALLLLTGLVNSVNIADGIDGLAATETFVVGLFFAMIAFLSKDAALTLAAGCTVGGCLGFLVYNFYPARVFMGDTGSLFLGAMVIGMGFLCGNPLIVLIAGIMYIAETASVILQTLFYKATRALTGTPKRLFSMSPLHHHFEHERTPDKPAVLRGHTWSEIKIVSVFSSITLIFCVISFIMEYIR